MTKWNDPALAGTVHGRLTLIEPVAMVKGDQSRRCRTRQYWRARCACGNEKLVEAYSLLRGSTESCGCLYREAMRQNGLRNTRHGMARHGDGKRQAPEYWAWINMNRRCHDPKFRDFASWGGRGIRVCDRWRSSFESFLSDMGERPSRRHSIDRHPNNDGNYEPGNCRWATVKEQADNRRTSMLIDFNGITMSEADWCRRLGCSQGTIARRLRRGWSVERAVTVSSAEYAVRGSSRG